MTEQNLNPTSLSKKARLNITAVRDMLQHEGTPNPRIDTFFKLCRALGVGPHQLSPEFATLYTPSQVHLLDEVYEVNKHDRKPRKEIVKDKKPKKPV